MKKLKIRKIICGEYQQNCYLVEFNKKCVVIDAGDGAAKTIEILQKNPQKDIKIEAILCTHGHFDHIWDNALINAPIYIHENDVFMLQDPFKMGHLPSSASVVAKDKSVFNFGDLSFCFHYFPGHTPGCCMVEIVGFGIVFSGDFLFAGTIGRFDFPYSDTNSMKNSLLKIKKMANDGLNFCVFKENLEQNMVQFIGFEGDECTKKCVENPANFSQTLLLPGHSKSTFLSTEIKNIDFWLKRM